MKTLLNLLALLLMPVAVSIGGEKTVIRIGHFPNITHMQGLVAHNRSRQGKGWFGARDKGTRLNIGHLDVERRR
jgi:NitT/TauT family transport system substrate-binding protein